ncbi:MAG: 1,4-dihydroxy-2-naphthoate polyprenyltransferase [Candidatus Phosphoribacter sp.]|nr:1,4-dihydroxy-2-naphthoate polyprenyltransferase [Actinomycetales bacterium]
MATLAEWVAGARPRTLPAAVSPVLVGTGAAYAVGRGNASLAVLALAVSLALQVAVNYANDYSDGVRGTDARRVGPVRLVGQGLAAPGDVKLAAYVAFFLAALFGFALIALSESWILVPIGVACIAAAWGYTGGRRPYGYRGLGEVMVFVFFGLVATLGTLMTQARTLTWPGLACAVGVGALASAILVANNLRDIPTDRVSGKTTLAVRLGDPATRRLWGLLVVVALAMVVVVACWYPLALLALPSAALAVAPWRVLRSGALGRELVPVLVATGRLQLGYAVLLAAALIAAGSGFGPGSLLGAG